MSNEYLRNLVVKMNWDKQQQNWIKEILSKSGTELKEITDKDGTPNVGSERF